MEIRSSGADLFHEDGQIETASQYSVSAISRTLLKTNLNTLQLSGDEAKEQLQ